MKASQRGKPGPLISACEVRYRGKLVNRKMYLRVDRSSIDVADLGRRIEPWVSGGVLERMHTGWPLAENPLRYWKSSDHSVDGANVEEVLLKLVKAFHEGSKEFPPRTVFELAVVVVMEYGEGEAPEGLYLSAESIETLAALKASLDIDCVPVLR